VLLVAMVATIGCDRVTKHFAATTLAGTSRRSFLADTVRLEYGENTGGFLSLGANLPAVARISVFVIGTGVALLFAVWVAVRSPVNEWTLLGLSLFVGGGASNWVDRVTRGSVIDFLNVGLGSLRTGIFNVADMAIMLGAGIIVITEIRGHQSGRRLHDQTDDEP
jgi:signal peptidase II